MGGGSLFSGRIGYQLEDRECPVASSPANRRLGAVIGRRRHECRRGTQECVRHIGLAVMFVLGMQVGWDRNNDFLWRLGRDAPIRRTRLASSDRLPQDLAVGVPSRRASEPRA